MPLLALTFNWICILFSAVAWVWGSCLGRAFEEVDLSCCGRGDDGCRASAPRGHGRDGRRHRELRHVRCQRAQVVRVILAVELFGGHAEVLDY